METAGSQAGYSPHPRGCFYPNPAGGRSPGIFPASAGVFLLLIAESLHRKDIPRIRGGVSVLADHLVEGNPIFPASAGVFPIGTLHKRIW